MRPRELSSRTSQTVIVCAAVASTQVTWSAIAPVLPALADTFEVTSTHVGLVVSLFGLGRMLINVPAGMLMERVDAARLLQVSMLGVVVFSALCGLAPTFPMLLVARLLTGLAGGVAITTGMALLIRVSPAAHYGRAMSTLKGFQLFGGAVAPGLGGVAAALWGLRAPFWMSGSAALGVLLVVRTRLPLAPPTPAQSGGSGVSGLVRDRSFITVCVVGFAVFFNRFGGMHTLVPLIAFELAGMEVGIVGVILGLTSLTNLLSILFVGRWSDRIGRKRIIVASLLAAGGGALCYLLTAGVVSFLIATLIMGGALGFGGATPAAYLADVATEGRRGAAVGVFRTCGDLGGVVGPLTLGWLLDVAGHGAAIIGLAAFTAVPGLLFGLLANETVGPRAAHPT